MINGIIWLLTDTDFSEEWNNASFFGKLELIYTTTGFLTCWLLNILLVIDAMF